MKKSLLIFVLSIFLMVFFCIEASAQKTIEEHRKNKKAKRLKKATVPKRRSLLRKIFAKLHLWSSHREWQKSNNARSIPVMQRKFKKWAKNARLLSDLEYGKLEIGRPDKVIFLTAPFDLVTRLKNERKSNEG